MDKIKKYLLDFMAISGWVITIWTAIIQPIYDKPKNTTLPEYYTHSWTTPTGITILVIVILIALRRIRNLEKSYNSKIENIINTYDAAFLHLQGNYYSILNKPFAVIFNFMKATFSSLRCEDYPNAQNELRSITAVIKNEAITKSDLLNNGIDIPKFADEVYKIDSKHTVVGHMSDLMRTYKAKSS